MLNDFHQVIVRPTKIIHKDLTILTTLKISGIFKNIPKCISTYIMSCPTFSNNLDRYLVQVSRLHKSYLTFSPFEDLVSQELMVVVDIGLHLLLHSRPRDFFFFFFSPSNHVGIWLRPFMLIQMFKLRWILIKYEVFQRTEYYMSFLTDNISTFLRKQVKSEYDYVIHNYVCILKKLAALRMT